MLSRHGQHVLIGDTKYKRLDDAEHKHADLYQMLAYCTSLGVRAGVLIYPRHIMDVDTRLTIRNCLVRIREVSIDLGGRIAHIEAELDDLAARLQAWSDA